MRRAWMVVVALAGACTGGDTDSDTDTDTDPGEPIAWACDGSPTYVGDDGWPWVVEVEETVTLCGSFFEGRTLETEIAAKAQLQIAKGTYRLPADAEDVEVRLPVCLKLADGETRLASDPGRVTGRSAVYDDNVSVSASLRQPFAGGGELSARFYTGHTVGEPVLNLVIDGNGTDPWGDSGVAMSWCKEAGSEWCNGIDGTTFESCNPLSYQLQTHTLTFDGGELVLDVRMGASAAGTEPAAFVKAAGTIDGTAFVQQDYWKLIYRPAHHHFSRDFAVFFDAPIGGACGVRVLALDPWEGGQLPTLDLVECDLTSIEARTVTGHVWDRG